MNGKGEPDSPLELWIESKFDNVAGQFKDIKEDIKTIKGYLIKFTDRDFQFTKDIAVLNTKVKIWGGLSGLIAGGIMSLILRTLV